MPAPAPEVPVPGDGPQVRHEVPPGFPVPLRPRPHAPAHPAARAPHRRAQDRLVPWDGRGVAGGGRPAVQPPHPGGEDGDLPGADPAPGRQRERRRHDLRPVRRAYPPLLRALPPVQHHVPPKGGPEGRREDLAVFHHDTDPLVLPLQPGEGLGALPCVLAPACEDPGPGARGQGDRLGFRLPGPGAPRDELLLGARGPLQHPADVVYRVDHHGVTARGDSPVGVLELHQRAPAGGTAGPRGPQQEEQQHVNVLTEPRGAVSTSWSKCIHTRPTGELDSR
mmetsp:Transcript_86827/g.246238  ORF Transcript_86827/g.246238 Transcript_86827/m.246238 type:complete len:280 (-) Transcript_86827:31-870(-)